MSLPRRVSANSLQTSRRPLALDRLPRFDIRARDDMSICVYLRLNAGITETSRDNLRQHSQCQKESGVGVSQVVEARSLNFACLDYRAEPSG